MIGYMTDKVGLVHQLPFTCDREGFAATFEKVNVHYGKITESFFLKN